MFNDYDTVWYHDVQGYSPKRGIYGPWYKERIITVYIAKDDPDDVVYALDDNGYAVAYNLRKRDPELNDGDKPPEAIDPKQET